MLHFEELGSWTNNYYDELDILQQLNCNLSADLSRVLKQVGTSEVCFECNEGVVVYGRPNPVYYAHN